MLTPLGLVVALVLTAPALWDAANGSLSLGAALLRLLAALGVVAVATAILRRVTAPQPHPVPRNQDGGAGGADGAPAGGHPARRRDDA